MGDQGGTCLSKHILVEKPIALSAYDAEAVYYEAKKVSVFAGEAFMYRVHPQTEKLVELVKSGVIGTVRIIRSSFGFNMGSYKPEHRLFANDTVAAAAFSMSAVIRSRWPD